MSDSSELSNATRREAIMNDDRPADDTDVTRKNLGQSAMNDDTLREKLKLIFTEDKGPSPSFLDGKLDAAMESVYQYSLTKQLEARVDELEKLGNTTNYDEVPYFTGIAWEVMQERIRALKTPHEWKANDTLSVFKCRKCGITGFAPHPLPEYGCNAELKHQLGKDK